MLKKSISLLLVLCALCCCMTPASAAQSTDDVIRLKLNSEVAGCTERDVDQWIELLSDNVVLGVRTSQPVGVSDYAGTTEPGRVVAGRTYYVHYSLSPAEGFVLPEELNEDNLEIECGKGVSVYATQITTSRVREDDGELHTYKGILIYAKVVIDGNWYRRVVGFLYDVYLKIRAWSLY